MWIKKIYANVDILYPSPQKMADRAASVINVEMKDKLTHGELLAFSVHYLSTMIPNMPSEKYAFALKTIAFELLDFHYISLLSNILELTPEDFITKDLPTLNRLLEVKIGQRLANDEFNGEK